jgi:hypothetical protein
MPIVKVKRGAVATEAPKLRGLGDLVAVAANPIARMIGLDKSKCGCAKRQEALNKFLPFGSHGPTHPPPAA